MQTLKNFHLPDGFRGRSAIVVQIWWLVQSIVFQNTPQFMYGFRRALLRAFGAKIGRDVKIRPTCRVTYPWKVEIGDFSWIGDFVELYSLGDIKIGRNAVISQRSYLCTGSHKIDALHFDIFAAPISVGDGAWLAANVFVHPGITIGDNSVIAACSVVKKSIPPNLVYEGNPAEEVKSREFNEDTFI